MIGIFGFIGFDAITQGGPIAAEPLSDQATPAPINMEWTNDTSIDVNGESGVQAND